MTTFEIFVLLALGIIVLSVMFGGYVMCRAFDKIIFNQDAIQQDIQRIEVNTHHASSVLKDHIVPNIECIYNAIGADGCNNFKKLSELTDIVDKMHRNMCVEIADKMVERTFPIKEGEPLDTAFEPDYKMKKDIECKLNGFAAAVLDAECCTKEIVDFWLERICDAAYKYNKQLKIDWDKLSKEQQDEFLKRLIMPNYDSPFQPPFNPTCETTNKED